ncbi:MAG: KamA family radical SAM protein [Phycisphaerae bacterium]|nr:KamA family radical SAM protein [Phycisphaerae bacterium]
MDTLQGRHQPLYRHPYLTDPRQLVGLSPAQREAAARVAEKYAFRANAYYLGLIDWNDPDDPIRHLIVPHGDELADWGDLDASNEAANTVAPGVQHKYPRTVLLLCTQTCGGFCRYCFRKRLFMRDNRETARNLETGLDYIARTPKVTNVLLTGGDPLMLSTGRLAAILERLRAIPHVRIIRIGSKMPAFNPWRILDDDELVEMLGRFSTPENRLYLMTHFDHPRELTEPATEALDRLVRAGVICANQCPIVRGVNDSGPVLARLFRELSYVGCPPYYVFQGRPTAGNQPYETPLVRSYRIMEMAKRHCSGLAKRARLVMSHASGKIEMVGLDDKRIYLRYHRAKSRHDRGRFMVFHRDDEAFWLDQLRPVD